MNQTEIEVIDSTELAKRLNVPETWVRSRTNANAPAIRFRISGSDDTFVSLGVARTPRVAGSSVGECEQGRVIKENKMTKSVRYQDGQFVCCTMEPGSCDTVNACGRRTARSNSSSRQRCWERCGLSARIPDRASENRIHAAAECRQVHAGK